MSSIYVLALPKGGRRKESEKWSLYLCDPSGERLWMTGEIPSEESRLELQGITVRDVHFDSLALDLGEGHLTMVVEEPAGERPGHRLEKLMSQTVLRTGNRMVFISTAGNRTRKSTRTR